MPNFALAFVVRNVAIPSGILCRIIANIENIPILYNLLSFAFSKSDGRYLFISNDTITPIAINDSVSRVDGNI